MFLTRFAIEGHARPPARRVPRLADHDRPRPRNEKIEFVTPYVVEEVLGENGQTTRACVLRDTRDRRDARARRPTASSSRSATTRTRSSSSTSSTTTRPATSSRSPARPRRTSRASSRPATSRTTSTARRSPPPAPAAWPRSTPSASSPSREGHAGRRCARRSRARSSRPLGVPSAGMARVDRPARPDERSCASAPDETSTPARCRACSRRRARRRAAAEARGPRRLRLRRLPRRGRDPRRGSRLLPGDRLRGSRATSSSPSARRPSGGHPFDSRAGTRLDRATRPIPGSA